MELSHDDCLEVLADPSSVGRAASTKWPAFMASARSSWKNTGEPFWR